MLAPNVFYSNFRCLGSTQHLKNTYGGGYILDVKLHNDQWPALEEYIISVFPGATATESFSDRRTYSIEQASVTSLAEAFQALESCK